ncbi:MAG: amidohydrolase/deacetylase family metallohydrolase [Gammaproteobacteria bacterium]
MYDLLLKNGRVMDPARDVDAILDVAFAAGRIARIDTHIAEEAREVRDLKGAIVTPGLIDLHTHVYWGGTALGVDPDSLARQSGCTTLVDAGSAGAGNFIGMRRHIVEPAKARVLAYLNVSFAGIFAFSKAVMVGECADVRLLNARECVRVGREHPDLITGIKVRVGQYAGGASGVAPLDIALEVAEELGLPVMSHLDFPPPSRKEVLDRLRSGDVLTHCFRPFPNAPVRTDGAIFDEVLAARDRGVIFDIGHGMGSLGFATARRMLDKGFFPDVISSDVHALSIEGPAFDLPTTMSKFLCLGMALPDIVRAVTATPAQALRRFDLGTLRIGAEGDATVLEIQDGEYPYLDALGERFIGDQRIAPAGMVRAGVWWPTGQAV